MDFRQGKTQRKPPRNYFARREQHRLFLLVGTLALVIFLISQAAKPANWAWLWGQGEPPAPAAAVDGFFGGRPKPYDTRIRPTSPEQLPLDTFIAPRDEPATSQAEAVLPGLQPDLLASVRDNTVFRAAEVGAWYNLLVTLKESDEAQIEKESVGLISFVQLYEQPNEYRGKLVTVKGIVKRAFDLKAPKNDHGIEGFYQLWLQPDSGPLSPIVIYTLELPPGFPSSRIPNSDGIAEIREQVEVTGFFYKKWAYATGTTILSAPLIVAKTVDWRPRPAAQKEQESFTYSKAALAIAAALLLGMTAAYLMVRVGRPQPNEMLSELAARYKSPALQQLADEDLGPDVGETLRALAAEAASAENPEQPPS